MPIAVLVALLALSFGSAGFGMLRIIEDRGFPTAGERFLTQKDNDRRVQEALDVAFSARHRTHLLMVAGGFAGALLSAIVFALLTYL